MLRSKTKWNFLDINSESIWDLNEISPLVKELLVQRGINSSEAAREFLSPDLANLHNPLGLSGIEKATDRVHKAIAEKEKVLVFGDYDADGVSSTTVLLEALQELGADCEYYIPNRFTEGYGPNEDAFKAAAENGFSLIITVDTGIAADHEATIAKELGIDLIITDHHEPQEELPDAYTIIHPKCSPDYLFKELAGVGVAFKFAEHLLGYFPKQFLDLAAIGTIADLVPLVNENRILAYYGLKTLSTTGRPGLIALKKVCNITGNVNEEDIGFKIGPRINAVGRLQDADLAVQLMLADDQEEADHIAEMVQSLNQERQKIVSDIVKEADKMVGSIDEQGVIVVAKEGWNQGVLGIVASNLVRKYDRPAIVLSILPETNQVKGSARSIPAFDLFANCMKIRDVFTHFGGHSQAAGMTLPLENLNTLQSELNKIISQQLSKEDFAQEIEVSKTIAVPEVNEEIVNEISQLAPFGMANPKPIFHLKHIPSDVRQIGNMKKHLKMQFKQDNTYIDGIAFGLGNLYDYISPMTPVSVAGELGINEWNGNKKVQIVVQDMKIEDKQLFDHRGKKGFDITPFVNQDTSHIAVHYTVLNDRSGIPDHVTCITYESDISMLDHADTLYLYELPSNLEDLRDLVRTINPVNIHVCFQLEDSVFMKVFPSREDFKWLYGLVAKRRQIDLQKELPMIMDAKAWTKDRVLFMSNVFFELEFVKIENGIIKYNPNPVKQDLANSKLYQERLNQAEIEKVLYYSTYEELKNWFITCIQDGQAPKEELTYGL
ncbi:single-stranded-DNA-specific exonuclease RecJ [Virgibacillus doumboii]|uniref:single-stranded-DNA-specific exonuclease RecJ n=1 Tax=Virgibacillus doumboii TaxID=2697503 RepID=UPI0013DFF943|nr:single-stranded-DNA-specific exonuclease RecJ [Virgibacillus doumboii]